MLNFPIKHGDFPASHVSLLRVIKIKNNEGDVEWCQSGQIIATSHDLIEKMVV